MCSTVTTSDMTSKVYTQKEVVLLETSITEFHEKFYIPSIKKWNFICRMCISSEPTTVANNVMRHLNDRAVYMIFYAIVIMQSGQYPVFIIKSNKNIIMVIGMYPFMSSPQNALVRHTIPFHFWHHIMCHGRQFFTAFCMITAHSIPQTQMKTVNTLLKCCKTEQCCLFTLLIYATSNKPKLKLIQHAIQSYNLIQHKTINQKY